MLRPQYHVYPSLELSSFPKYVRIDSKSFNYGQNFSALIVHSNCVALGRKELSLTLSSTE